MRLDVKFRNVIVEIISLLFVLLFVYAAVSKILDFENFKVQIGQSPMLSIYAEWISWAVIFAELLIALLLAIPFTKIIALFLSLSLMTMFTAYIFILLHFSPFVPCSCGGILEKMSWNSHLIFNCIFILLSVFAVVLKYRSRNKSTDVGRVIKLSIGIVLFSIFAISILFLTSEQVMHHDNPFIRRYPRHPVEFSNKIDLKYNSYYIAGSVNNRIYLANYKYPSYLLSMDTKLVQKKIERIKLDPKKIPFKMITTSINGTYIYLADGSVPIILRGDVKTWIINKELKGIPYFTKAIPIQENRVVLRSNNSKDMANVLGVFDSDSIPKVKFHKELLQKQIDGIFDTDGTLLYSQENEKIVYLYHYRNEFIVADKNGNLIKRGHTIDTISRARLKVTTLNNGKRYAMSSPSFNVNGNAAVFGNLLFVYSKVKGRFENDKLWKSSFIIDVYDIERNTYVLSFPVYHTAFDELSSFAVTKSHLYAVIGTDFVVYKLKKKITEQFK